VVCRGFSVWCVAVVLLGGCGGSTGNSATFTPASHSPRRSHGQTLRLLQFNVMEGATGGRAAGVATLIERVRPDVATLDEVTSHTIFQHIAAVTHMYGYWVLADRGPSVGILSRVPLHDCTRYAAIQHAAYSCRVKLGGRSWWVFGTHLVCCHLESLRAQALGLLIPKMNVHHGSPVVLAGDLNSHSPGELDPDAPPNLLAIPELLRAGYIDSFRELHSVAQDPGFTVTAPPYGKWGARLDYVFHSRLARAKSAKVIRTVPGHQWPSDHAALLVTLAPIKQGS
jgi:endonuclease/exonuclease/phosphatase family metal-dependent hydrolase